MAHLVADRVAEIAGDHELVRGVPGPSRGHFDRAILLVEDSRALDGDLAEDRLEGEGSRPLPLDAGIGLAVPLLEDQLLVGLLDEDAEESALDLEAGVMDEGLDLIGEMLVLERHGQGHLKREFNREGLIDPVDGAAGDGSLEAVSLARDESPSWIYGGSSCVFSPIRLPKSLPKLGSPHPYPSLAYAIYLSSRTNRRALGKNHA